MTLKTQSKWRVKHNDEGDPSLTGKYGVITEYQDGDLDVWVKSMIVTGRMERAGHKARHHYDDGAVFIFAAKDLDIACKYVKAPKRRHLTPEQAKVASERLVKYHFLKKNTQPSASASEQNV